MRKAMYLYLAQHGKAVPNEQDPERPLSMEGRHETKRVASLLAKGPDISIQKIYHSGKLRAEQTAAIFARELRLQDRVEMAKELNPTSLPWGWVERLVDMQENVMIVGHLPHLKRLTALLVCQDESKKCVEFRNAGVVCLFRDESGIWSLRWIIIPQILPKERSL
jgi:phosphohistidine phosphatase